MNDGVFSGIGFGCALAKRCCEAAETCEEYFSNEGTTRVVLRELAVILREMPEELVISMYKIPGPTPATILYAVADWLDRQAQ